MGDPDDDYNYGLEGKFLEQVGRLEKLQYINLDQNSFDGTISRGVENLQQLGKSMKYSSLFFYVLLFLTRSYLEFLSAGNNHFSGTIPTQIAALPNLKELWMSVNDFSGPLPLNIGDAASLEVIYLWVHEKNDKMNGSLPDSLYNLKNLKKLSLSGHAFSGEIKTEIRNLSKLTEFKISGNEFSGTLPSEIGLLEQLGEYDVLSSTFRYGS
jgi:hypothetical protein